MKLYKKCTIIVMIFILSAIDCYSLGGIFEDYFVGSVGYCYLEGKSLRDISHISLISLNDKCTVVNSDNYNKIISQYKGIEIEKPHESVSFEKGEEIALEPDKN